MDDLCIICPNAQWKAVIEAFLERNAHLGIREITYRVVSLPMGRQAFAEGQGPEMAASLQGAYTHCMMVLDADRSSENISADDLEKAMDARLRPGWEGGAKTVVADPCLESWLLEGHRVFSRIATLKGIDVRRWFADEGLWPMGAEQPDSPREAMRALLTRSGQSASAASYRMIAEHFPIRYDRIESPSLRKFLLTLHRWFMP